MSLLTEANLLETHHHPPNIEFPPEIAIYDINGPLFFGASGKALSSLHLVDPKIKTVILVMHDVQSMDMSGLRAFVAKTGPIAMPVAVQAERILVVFGSDHGLCGNYNEVLALKPRSEASKAKSCTRVLCVGARMNDALSDQGLSPEVTFLPPASADGIGRLASDIVTRLDEIGDGDVHNRIAVTLAFTRRAGRGQHEPVVSPLLPVAPSLLSDSGKVGWQSRSLPDYTMRATPLLASLLRNHIFASVFHASAEAMVTENAARLALMQQAEQAVDDRLDEVGGQFRLVRQDEITNELMDIIIGFEALKKKSPAF